MAQAGVYAPGSVIDADVTVRVNGVVREHVSMDWAGDTTGGLPEQVVSAGTGMRSRTGTILWAQQGPVEVEPPHPLRQTGGWPPREGDSVVIDSTVDTGQGPYTYRRFTGRLGRTTGSLTEGTLTSQITDRFGDALRAQATVPPTASTAAYYSRSVWTMYQAIAQAGLAAIPGPDQDTILWNGYQGGLQPLVGKFRSSGTEYADGSGLTVWSGPETATNGAPRNSRDVLVLSRAGLGATQPSVALRIGPRIITLSFNHTTGMYGLHATGVGSLGTWPRRDNWAVPILAFRVSGVGIRVYTSATTWSDVTSLVIPQSDLVDQAGGDRIIGVSVRYTSSANAQRVVASTAELPIWIQPSALEQERIPATRGVENVTARSVVDAWSEATLASLWMDEHGRPYAIARDRLVTSPLQRTVRVDERVFAGSWSVGDDSQRRRVIVKGQEAAIDRTGDGSLMQAVIYQESSSRSFDTSEVIERFIEAPSEEEWGPVDLTANRFGIDPMLGAAPGRGTWIGAVSSLRDSSDDPETWVHQSGIGYSILIERLGQRTLKVTETLTGVPSTRSVYLKAADAFTQIHPAYRGVPSPTIRGEWKTTWADFTVAGASEGQSWAEDLIHDSSWWLTPADAQRVADALAAEVTQPMPTLSSVSVLWDPRRQIGDVEEWIAVDKTGAESWRARVLVTGYAEAWDGQVPTQSVDVRVIAWTDPTSGKTYNDLAQAYATYAGITGTYQQVYDALPGAR